MRDLKNNQVRIRYLQLGKYRVTLVGVIDSWSGSEIDFYDNQKRYHKLSLANVLRIEPIHIKTDAKAWNEKEDYTEQSSLDDYL
ncbi:hypothetical protein [Desulfuribacillus alkaliarsenatis]|uniref:Uncharacterized protein n=1 Tax=Desulfuribacillus alkaliarsenatis TaxID=766136 RepID=A0A1E5G5C5_9FIRM|nr:hypothetical protein [Desulfuribacillus alkaliarsenatis]OEF98390.1 hypothetical protein BHF68_01550 [Desulfuribacillus alkaliarsenatis]